MFKCRVCGSGTVHQRTLEDGRVTTNIIDIRNYKSNDHVVFKACDECGLVYSFFHQLDTSPELTDKEKEALSKVAL